MTSILSGRPLIPLNLETCLSSPDWLQNPWWPINQGKLTSYCLKPKQALHLLGKTVEPELKPIINLVSPLISNLGAALFEAALISEHENFLGQSLIQKSLLNEKIRENFLLACTQKKTKR